MKRHHKSFKRRLIERHIRHFGFRCFYCGVQLYSSTMTTEHLNPASKGGELTETNITLSCPWCNRTKSDKTYEEIDISSIQRYTHYRRILETLQIQKRVFKDWGRSYLLASPVSQ